MKESDILHSNGGLWIAKQGKEYILYKDGITHAKGFLSFKTLDHAIENCDSLVNRPDLVEKLIK